MNKQVEPAFCDQNKCLRKVLPPHIYCSKHEDPNSAPIGHRHEYTIPVEWEDDTKPNQYPRMVHKVTKLRCACGEEIER